MEATLFDQQTTDFQRYDAEHPEIWEQFKEITFNLIRRNRKHYGAKAVFEIIRFHRFVKYNDIEFKVNNNYTADYARKFHRLHPEYDGFFELRKVKINV